MIEGLRSIEHLEKTVSRKNEIIVNKASPENVSLGVNFLLLYGPTVPMQSFKRHKPREKDFIDTKYRKIHSLPLRTSRTHSHPWSAQVWRRSSSSRRCHWPPARWGWGASWRWGRAPGTGNPRPPPSPGPAFIQLVISEFVMPAGFYLSCNIFCLNLKWSSRDFSFPLSFFLLIRVVVKFEEVFFFLTVPFESLIVVLWDLSWLVAFKSLLSSEGLSLLKFHVSCWRLFKYSHIYIKSAKNAS